MEDEGYTSPPEELDTQKQLDDVHGKKYPYYDRPIQCWEDLGKTDSTNQRGFLTDNQFPSNEFSDWIWKISTQLNSTTIGSGKGSISVLKTSNNEPTYISMSEFIYHLFHLLNGRASQSFTYIPEEGFKRNPFILIKGITPTALDNYSTSFILSGQRFKKLSNIASQQNQNNNNNTSSNRLFISFQKTLENYLKIYQVTLIVKMNSFNTFTKLKSFMEPFHTQLKFLDKISDVAIKESQFNLLSELNRIISSHGLPSNEIEVDLPKPEINLTEKGTTNRRRNYDENIEKFIEEVLCNIDYLNNSEEDEDSKSLNQKEESHKLYPDKSKLKKSDSYPISRSNQQKLLFTPITKARSTFVSYLNSPPTPSILTASSDEVDVSNQNARNYPQVITRKRNYNKKIEKTMEEILAFKQDTKSTTPVSLSPEEEPRKLDPERFILTKANPTPQFDLQIFIQQPKGISEFLSSNVDEDNKSKVTEGSSSQSQSIDLLFAKSVLIPLRIEKKKLNNETLTLRYFIKEQELFKHISFINDFLLLQNGVFGHHLSTLLIDEMIKCPLRKSGDLSKRIGRFNMILSEALSIAFFNQDSDPFSTNLSFALVQDKDALVKEFMDLDSGKINSHISSDFQILNALRLNYSVKWPLNIVITEDMMSHYERLFAVLMQLLRSEILLHQIFLYLKSKRSGSHQFVKLQFFRLKFLHFVRSIRFYMNAVIIQNNWIEFCNSFHELDSLQKIYDSLIRYIRDVSINCFTGKQNGILKLIVRHLAMVDSFCSQVIRVCVKEGIDWDNGEEMSDKDFKDLKYKYLMAEKFEKLILEILYKASAKESYSKIDCFLEFYDYNNFYEVSNQNHSLPPPFLKTTSVPAQSKNDLNVTSLQNITTSFYL